MKTTRGHSRLIAATGVLTVLASVGTVTAGDATGSPTATPSCRAAQLQIWRADPGSGAAGSVYYELEFSNVSSSTCTLHGYPGVSAVTDSGQQLGSAAARDPQFPPTTVTLAPGATAHAALRIADVSVYPAASCEPVTAKALKIYAPDQAKATVLPFRFRACTQTGTAYLHVRTVRPHVGIPGYSR